MQSREAATLPPAAFDRFSANRGVAVDFQS